RLIDVGAICVVRRDEAGPPHRTHRLEHARIAHSRHPGCLDERSLGRHGGTLPRTSPATLRAHDAVLSRLCRAEAVTWVGRRAGALGMLDGLVEAVEGVMNTPWIYLALLAIAAIDAFFPAVPSETLVITAGVFAAATGAPNAVLVVLVAAAGAFAG